MHMLSSSLSFMFSDFGLFIEWLNLQLVLGGPFLPHIERILRDKASIFFSPVVSASDTANRSTLKGVDIIYGTPRQSCDIVLQIEKDLRLVYK